MVLGRWYTYSSYRLIARFTRHPERRPTRSRTTTRVQTPESHKRHPHPDRANKRSQCSNPSALGAHNCTRGPPALQPLPASRATPVLSSPYFKFVSYSSGPLVSAPSKPTAVPLRLFIYRRRSYHASAHRVTPRLQRLGESERGVANAADRYS